MIIPVNYNDQVRTPDWRITVTRGRAGRAPWHASTAGLANGECGSAFLA